MDQEVVILGPDGTEHVFPSGFDPKKAAAIVRGGAAPKEEQGFSLGGLLENAKSDVGNILHGLNPANWAEAARAKMAEEGRRGDEARAAMQGGGLSAPDVEAGVAGVGDALSQVPGVLYREPVSAALLAAPHVPGVPKAAGAAVDATGRAAKATASTAGTAARAGLRVAAKPGVSSAIGGAVGYATGGPYGALLGLQGGGQIPRLIRSLNKALDKPKAAVAEAAPVAESGSGALARELLARDPDWRTVDAVPIDAITRDVSRGGSILEAGESQIGLMSRLTDALKAQKGGKVSPAQVAEAEMLARALRQRKHITAKSARR
jgi:hypothetical protein